MITYRESTLAMPPTCPKNGDHLCVPDLIAKIERFVRAYNLQSEPFVWTATADSILQKLERLCKAIAGTRH